MELDFLLMKIIWWLLIPVIMTIFMILGGADLGILGLFNVVSKTEEEKRVVLNVIAPTWETNQVWFILLAGVPFAAWPLVYSLIFSSLYVLLFFILLFIILKPVALEFRKKGKSKIWKKSFDILLTLSGLIPSFLFGILLGNIFTALDYSYDEYTTISSNISFWKMFTPQAISLALAIVFLTFIQGSCYLNLKTLGSLKIELRKLFLLPILQ